MSDIMVTCKNGQRKAGATIISEQFAHWQEEQATLSEAMTLHLVPGK
jgi:hypothetical protein